MAIRILAFSDLHGHGFARAEELVRRHSPDWIVLCGDMLFDFAQRLDGAEAQRAFWLEQRHRFQRPGAVTTYVRGNHERRGFLDAGMLAVPPALAGRVIRLEGIPVDPGQKHSFAQGSPDEVLEAELTEQLRLAPEPLVYISHAPPYGSCDRTNRGTHIGGRPLFAHLARRGWPQALVLCGHVHQSFGLEQAGGTTVLNVATGYALLDLEDARVSLLEQGRLASGGNFWDAP